MPSQRIFIHGAVGSGKSTLARELSRLSGIPWYELDNVVFERRANGDRRRTPEEISEIFGEILSGDSWIVESAWRRCFTHGFAHAQRIIWLDPPSHVRRYRVTKRWLLQILRLIHSNYKPRFKMLYKMHHWTSDYNRSKHKMARAMSDVWPQVIRVKSGREALKLFMSGKI